MGPVDEYEPIVFYNPMDHRKLRNFYWFFLDRDFNRTVKAIGRRHGFYSRAKWFTVLPAFSGEGVAVCYMDGPEIDLSNWEYALAGASPPVARFLEGYAVEEQEGILELRLSFYFMVFGK